MQAYFAMGHEQGRVWLLEGNLASEVFWARYADWTFTTPLLLAHLCLYGGLAADQWVTMIIADVLMILTGLGGEFATDESKWAWWGFACICQRAHPSAART